MKRNDRNHGRPPARARTADRWAGWTGTPRQLARLHRARRKRASRVRHMAQPLMVCALVVLAYMFGGGNG